MLPIYHENTATNCHFLKIHILFTTLPPSFPALDFLGPPTFSRPAGGSEKNPFTPKKILRSRTRRRRGRPREYLRHRRSLNHAPAGACMESCAGAVWWSGVAGLARSPSAGPGRAGSGWLVGGVGGRIYPAIRRLYRARKTPPARLSGSGWWPCPGPAGGACKAIFNRRSNRPPQRPPVRLVVRAGRVVLARFGPLVPVRLMQAGRVRLPRRAGPVRRGPALAHIPGAALLPVAGPARLLVRFGPLALVRLLVLAGRVVLALVRLVVLAGRGHFPNQPRFLRPLHRAENFQ